MLGQLDHNTRPRFCQDLDEYMWNLAVAILPDRKHFDFDPNASPLSATAERNRIWKKATPSRYALKEPLLPSMLAFIHLILKQKCFAQGPGQMTCDKPKHIHTRNITSSAVNHPEVKAIKRQAARCFSRMRETEKADTWHI